MKVRGKRVFVGLSGGVDSAVTASLLQKAGAEVVGVFIKGWYPPGMPCTWAADRRDAMRVAAHLHIPFITLDASDEYKKGVIDYLSSEYRAGRTPNPDVMCNREVKFGAFFRYAMAHGADYIATGHYARAKDGRLFRGVDETKDQSYFLWAVPPAALAKTLFPLGEMRKEEVRAYARKLALPVAAKKDSQGICFLGSVSIEDFLRAEYGSAPGNAVDEAGSEVGIHDGALLYTIGERVPLPQGPWYVRRKDIERNILVVSRNRLLATEGATGVHDRVRLSQTNWFRSPESGRELVAEYRYHGDRVEGMLDASREAYTLTGPLKERIASGQSLVVYQQDELVGGGIIV